MHIGVIFTGKFWNVWSLLGFFWNVWSLLVSQGMYYLYLSAFYYGITMETVKLQRA